MSVAMARGCVCVSIDLGRAGGTSAGARGATEKLVGRLLDRLEELALPATWVLADPTGSPAAALIMDRSDRHELSMLVDGWQFFDAQRPRFEFMRWVIRPLQTAAKIGRRITTLSSPQPWHPGHIDLLTKYGVTMICSPALLGSPIQPADLQAVCYGLGHVEISATISGGGWMASRSESAAAVRAVQEAAVPGGFCHLRLDLPSIAASDASAALNTIDRALGLIERLSDARHVEVSSIRDLPRRLQRRRIQLPARSILRAA